MCIVGDYCKKKQENLGLVSMHSHICPLPSVTLALFFAPKLFGTVTAFLFGQQDDNSCPAFTYLHFGILISHTPNKNNHRSPYHKVWYHDSGIA